MELRRGPAIFLAMAMLASADASRARDLGRLIGEFSLDRARPVLRKPSAAFPRALPVAQERVRALARVTSDFDPASLRLYGWRLVSAYKGFAALEGDEAMFPLLREIPGLLELQPSGPVRLKMDAARKLSKVDGALAWGSDPAPDGFTGKGVLVGSVDESFDTHHPAFLDGQGKTRFLALWDTDLPSDGTSPFGYGRVRTRQGLREDRDFGQKGMGHGTHVISLAAGSDRSNPYYGMAPEASLIGVKLNLTGDANSINAFVNDLEVHALNGIQWIFQVADSLKMPCVVNLSLGHHRGPHDGASLFDRFLDSITGPGRLVVGAAGNENGNKLHADFPLRAGDTLGTWISGYFGSDSRLGADFWGEAGKPFSFKILLRDGFNGEYLASKGFLSSLAGTGTPVVDTLFREGGASAGHGTVVLYWTLEKADAGNGKPHLRLEMKNDADLEMGILLAGEGRVQAWNLEEGAFYAADMPGFVAGDDQSSVAEMAGTARSIITVGAYVSKLGYKDFLGFLHGYESETGREAGALAEFSSRGPTADGRTKPDICAPGQWVAGALGAAVLPGSPDSLSEGLADLIAVWPDLQSRQGRFSMAAGTSMAAPMVAGIAALMLEADPGLGPQDAGNILRETAYRDAFTGPLPSSNPLWGAGKVDAAAAVRRARQVNLARGSAAGAPAALRAQFVGGQLLVEGLQAAGKLRGEVFDWRGRFVASLSQAREGRFLLGRGLEDGVYIAVLKSERHAYRLRCFKN